MADLSRVRNAVRDMAESMRRFDSNWKRMQREMHRAEQAGASHADITRVCNEALRGDPDLLRRVNELTEAMAGREEAKGRG